MGSTAWQKGRRLQLHFQAAMYRPADGQLRGHDIQECICTTRRWEGAAGGRSTPGANERPLTAAERV